MRRIGFIKKGWVSRGGYVNPANVRFKEELPLKLRTEVSGKSGKNTGAACIQEMSVLFACLKKNEFKESSCSNELSTFQKCYDSHMSQKRAREEMERKGILAPGENNLSHKQATALLKKFP